MDWITWVWQNGANEKGGGMSNEKGLSLVGIVNLESAEIKRLLAIGYKTPYIREWLSNKYDIEVNKYTLKTCLVRLGISARKSKQEAKVVSHEKPAEQEKEVSQVLGDSGESLPNVTTGAEVNSKQLIREIQNQPIEY